MVTQSPANQPTSQIQTDLEAWLQHAPDFLNHSVQILQPTAASRALFAISQIPPSTPILRIPPTHLISSAIARKAPHVSAVLSAVKSANLHHTLPDALSDSAALLLYLIAELAKCPSSRYHPWLRSLPIAFSTPITSDSPAVNDLLRGTTLLPLATTLREELREMYEDWFLAYAVCSSDPLVAAAFPKHVCDYALFTRAHCVLESRAFRIDDLTILAPFADMANHRPSASRERNVLARGWAAVTDRGDVVEGGQKGLELYVGDRTVDRGEELCISYGALPNWQLLLHYGFAIEHNPEETVVVTLEVPENDPAQLFTLKMLFLNMEGMAELDVDHVLTVEDPLPMSLVASMRLFLLDEGEAAGISVSTANFGKAVSSRNERAVVCQLRGLVRSMLGGFDSFENGKEVAEDCFAEYCAVYVNGQREILSRAFGALEALSDAVATI